ncbi:Hsp70 family protein [Gulosibacter molinativorax]|uniref:Hsp70 family protein n=1 Tax=Gulosibacter molinativorax TaxID=256821 RepID=A0ABT7C8V3_9MICO|nr:Hsp70 family protein [Gulosibacter molinativorax]MDJ1371615.1 Hsp70 family protein [Gulosibacter molinativorax]QUY61042.1 Hsp70 protein [Gulosibacter molinativorax]
MRFGIDFGTTRTIIAAADRGNYPVLTVDDSEGDTQDYIPTQIALDGDRIVAGWDAVELARAGVPVARSFKRLLAAPGSTAATPVRIGEEQITLGEAMSAFANHIAEVIRRSELATGPLQAVVGVPANAHSGQRLLTLDAFSRAGIEVLALVNEPSAAAFEYTHRHPRGINSKRSTVVVFDLGGGTFDTSMVQIAGTRHEIVRSLGVNHLGGDDFDEVLALLARRAGDFEHDAMGERAYARLLDEARSAKERIAPQSRRIFLEFGDQDITVPVDEYYEASSELVERAIATVAELLGDDSIETLAGTDIAGIYLVGGASGLPLIPRLLRERFGRRVHRSPHPGASTAIGLAIAADPDSGYALRDRLARGIGVFREHDGGREVTFDPQIAPTEAPDANGEIIVRRRYPAAHNVGWFRFVEYSALDAQGEPTGDLSPLVDIVMPFDPELQGRDDLRDMPVVRREGGPLIEETVRVDTNGITSIRIADLDTGFAVEATATR